MAVKNILLMVILMIVSANAFHLLSRFHERDYPPLFGGIGHFLDGLHTDWEDSDIPPRYYFLRRFLDGNRLPFNTRPFNAQPIGLNGGSAASSAAASAAAGGAPGGVAVPRIYRHVSEIGAFDNDPVSAIGTHGSPIIFEN